VMRSASTTLNDESGPSHRAVRPRFRSSFCPPGHWRPHDRPTHTGPCRRRVRRRTRTGADRFVEVEDGRGRSIRVGKWYLCDDHDRSVRPPNWSALPSAVKRRRTELRLPQGLTPRGGPGEITVRKIKHEPATASQTLTKSQLEQAAGWDFAHVDMLLGCDPRTGRRGEPGRPYSATRPAWRP